MRLLFPIGRCRYDWLRRTGLVALGGLAGQTLFLFAPEVVELPRGKHEHQQEHPKLDPDAHSQLPVRHHPQWQLTRKLDLPILQGQRPS